MEIKKISIYELYSLDFEVIDVFAMRQKWKKGIVFDRFSPRSTCGILFLEKCNGRYFDGKGNNLVAPEKSLVCLPFNSIYSVLNVDCESSNSDAFLVEFNLKHNNELLSFGSFPFIINSINSIRIADLIKRIVVAYEEPNNSPLLLKSLIYDLLVNIAKEEYLTINKKYEPIISGIKLLNDDCLSEFSIDEIAKMCNISAGHFRKLFYEYTGTSPVNYKNNLKIEMAKNMVKESTASIVDIADLLGFDDISYFCRFFKKKVGLTPSEYRDKFLEKK